MFSYIIPLVALLIVFSNPIAQLFLSPNRALRTERPAINESLLAIPGIGDGEGCQEGYKVHVWSAEPLVVYIEGFLSEGERAHLLETSEPLFEPSTVTNDGSTTRRNTAVRDSRVALLPRDRTTRCVEARARAFQGWREEVWIERLRTQKYLPGGHYAHHYDWGSNAGGWGRVSSFMAWVGVKGLEGGGTEFPLLPSRGAVKGELNGDERLDGHGQEGELKRGEQGGSELGKEGGEDPWCRFVECEGGRVKTGEEGLGVTFKAIEGNAVFWTNFRADGSGEGYRETWHAGLPVTKGEKVGLNIWSWGRI